MRQPLMWVAFIAFALSMLLPAMASAQSVLEVFDVDTKNVESSFEESEGTSANISIYFSARQANGQPIAGLKAENVKLMVDKEAPPLASKSLRSFKEGDRPVGVVVVFPIAKDYFEEFFGIRAAVSTFLKQFRQVDWVGAVTYDSKATTYNPVTGADISGLADTIVAIENTEVIEPNLYSALPGAIALLKNLEGVKLKYLVVVSNAEGAVSGDDADATKKIRQFQDAVKKEGIRPLIVGYTPDGPDELTYRKWLKQMSLAGGTYTEATAMEDLPTAMNKVYDQIFQQYILDAEIDLSEDYWLEEGRYNFTVVAKLGSQELKGSQKAGWPLLEQSSMWIVWLILAIVGGLIFLALLIVIIRRIRRNRREREPEQEFMVVEQQGPQEFRCEVCGKIIPEALYGFRGEFCMSTGQPDCPYYQMPDRGRLIITKGPLADTTFFIKDEVTTVGSMLESSVALVDQSVSKKHAAIKVDEGNRYEIRDFGSTNGTWVNDDRVQRKFLKDGDVLRFGTVEVEFKLK